jgi:hypothetical protein
MVTCSISFNRRISMENKYSRYYETNNYGKLEVLSCEGNKMKIRFVDTGHERMVHTVNVIAGKVKDDSKPNHLQKVWQDCNEEFLTNSGKKLSVIRRKAGECFVRFEETGYIKKCEYQNVRNGKVTDPYTLSVYDKGFVGEFEKVHYWKQAKQLWQNMMKRCYSEKDQRGYFGRAFVDTRWLCFANFLEDLPKLKNFDLWLKGQKENSTKYNLDKDLLIPENRYYSKEACQFITEFENKSAGGKSRHCIK